MRSKIVSVDAIKLRMKHILEQMHFLPRKEQKEVICYVLESVKNLRTLISLNSGKLKQRHLLSTRCIAKYKNIDGYYRYVIRRKEYGLQAKTSNLHKSHQDDTSVLDESDEEERICNDENILGNNETLEPAQDFKRLLVFKGISKQDKCNYNIPCNICGDVSDNYINITTHLFNHSGASISCYKCKQSFNNLSMYKIHCNNDCSQYINVTSDELLQHLTSIVKKFGQKTESGYHCPYCAYGFFKPFNLRRHMKNACIANKTYQCVDCNAKFNNEVKYSEHLQQHSNYKCLKCDSYFPCKNLLKIHNRSHHKAPKNEYKCELCNVKFKNRLQFREHVAIHRNDKELHPVEKFWRVWCKVCNVSFFDFFTYNRHCTRKSHLSKVTDDKELLNMKTFMCVKCGQIFMTKEALTTHCTRIHSYKAKVTCEKCPYTTISKVSLNRHLQTHISGVKKNFFCHQCPSTFSSSSSLKDHITSVHQEERKFTCDSCPKTFKLKRLLTRHKTVHSSALPFVCVHCSLGFKRKAHLKRHTEARHKEHVTKTPALVIEKDSNIQNPLGESSKLLSMPPITMDNKDIRENIQTDRVFSLIDAQSGELVTLSATELSKSAVINMADGELLNEVHIPELWSHPSTMYSLDPMLQNNVLPQPQYNIITHDGNEMSQMLQNTLESTAVKDPIQYCIVPSSDIQPERTQDDLRYFYV